MRPFTPQYLRAVNNTFKSTTRSQINKLPIAKMASTDTGELRIENQNINTAPDVKLSDHQKTLVGSVLDLFAGRPSLAKLQLWKDDGVFTDPLTIARGRGQFEPQWYGLQTAFSEIERLHHQVNSSGNPIELDLKTRYVVKGVNKEKTINSKVLIHTEGDKISKVEDKWDGELPDSSISNVSSPLTLLNPFWWINYAEGWMFWTWSFVWETRVWNVSHALLCFLALLSMDRSRQLLHPWYDLLTLIAPAGFPTTQRGLSAENGRRTQRC